MFSVSWSQRGKEGAENYVVGTFDTQKNVFFSDIFCLTLVGLWVSKSVGCAPLSASSAVCVLAPERLRGGAAAAASSQRAGLSPPRKGAASGSPAGGCQYLHSFSVGCTPAAGHRGRAQSLLKAPGALSEHFGSCSLSRGWAEKSQHRAG